MTKMVVFRLKDAGERKIAFDPRSVVVIESGSFSCTVLSHPGILYELDHSFEHVVAFLDEALR